MGKAIIPAAGYGTRLLPITRVIPKVMAPLMTKPVIHYVIDELWHAGIRDALLVVGWKKEILQEYWEFKEDDMVRWLRSLGKEDVIDRIKRILPEGMRLSYVEQKVLNGMAGAILLGRDFVGDEDFVVALADNVIIEDSPGSLIREMLEAHRRFGAKVTLAVAEVPEHLVSKFGVIGYSAVLEEREDGGPRVFEVSRIVEKPPKENAPSRYAIVGRYVLSPEAFEYLERAPVYKGEISETDAFQKMAEEGHRVIAVDLGGRRWYDVGVVEGYAKAIMDLLLFAPRGLVDEETREKLRTWLQGMLSGGC